jgi:hypothetical protein
VLGRAHHHHAPPWITAFDHRHLVELVLSSASIIEASIACAALSQLVRGNHALCLSLASHPLLLPSLLRLLQIQVVVLYHL